MSVYRVVVDSAKRVSGTGMNSFAINVGNTFSTRDFIEKQYMMVVENISLLMYSTTSSTFAGNSGGPRFMTINCPELTVSNSYENVRGMDDTSIILALQAYCTGNLPTGVFGLNHDTPYARKAHLGTLVRPELLQKAGMLNFVLNVGGTVLQVPSACLTPDGSTVWGNNWSMTLVFFPVTVPEPEFPITPYSDFHKLWLNSGSRNNSMNSYPSNIELPIRYSTHGAMSIPNSKWFINVEFISPIYYASGTLPQCAYLTTTWNNSSNSTATTLCMLNRSFRAAEQGHYGVRYSIMPTARDHIGVLAPVTLDSLATIKLQIRDQTGSIMNGAVTSEFMVCLTFYRQY